MARFAAAPGPRGQTEDLEATAQRPTTRPVDLTTPVGMRELFLPGSGWTAHRYPASAHCASAIVTARW